MKLLPNLWLNMSRTKNSYVAFKSDGIYGELLKLVFPLFPRILWRPDSEPASKSDFLRHIVKNIS